MFLLTLKWSSSSTSTTRKHKTIYYVLSIHKWYTVYHWNNEKAPHHLSNHQYLQQKNTLFYTLLHLATNPFRAYGGFGRRFLVPSHASNKVGLTTSEVTVRSEWWTCRCCVGYYTCYMHLYLLIYILYLHVIICIHIQLYRFIRTPIHTIKHNHDTNTSGL